MAEPVAVDSPVDGPKAKGQTFKFDVAMSCGGCQGAIDRVLCKLEGVKKYHVDLDAQTAVVDTLPGSTLSFQEVNDKIAKTGKQIKVRYIDDQRVNEVGAPIDENGNLVAA